MNLNCFKAYDVRGKIPDELNEELVYKIGFAYANVINPKTVVVGCDVRLTSEAFLNALIEGLTDSGVDVLNIGLCGTEEVYFSVFNYKFDGGIMVTASHNPMDYNGLKFVKEESKPISGDNELFEIKKYIEKKIELQKGRKGSIKSLNHRNDYISHLLSYVNIEKLKKFKIVINSGNGCASLITDELEKFLPFDFIKIYNEPDGRFPNGIPNPLLPENRQVTINAIKEHNADLGIAWDGDFDRCFLFDENGEFIEGYYIVGLLAKAFLKKRKGEKIIHDPRLIWNTIEIVNKYGGIPIESKTGHAFIKDRMRLENAVYGGEMSAHHYFRDFSYCDSGMIPWLLVTELMCEENVRLSSFVEEMKKNYPVSGEINIKVTNAKKILLDIENIYKNNCLRVSKIDGLSMEFEKWRFNLRSSNTEPLLRLNVEAKSDKKLVEIKTNELLKLIK
jgi:phosphomannomutase